MENKKIAAIIVLMIFALSLTPKAYAQESSDIRTFYHFNKDALVIEVKAPANTEPGQTINVSVSFYCYGENLSIYYLFVTIYDFKSGQEKNPIGTIRHVKQGIGYDPQNKETYAQTYEIKISEDVWDITYGEIACEWEFGGHTFYIHNDGFVMTYVKNVEMEELIEQLTNKTQECDTLWQNYTQLNQTYWDLKGNQTSGTEVDLSNTRVAMVVFIITTVFFVATTLYLTLKKPREYW